MPLAESSPARRHFAPIDPNGNLIQKIEGGVTWTYVWDAENRLKCTAPMGVVAGFRGVNFPTPPPNGSREPARGASWPLNQDIWLVRNGAPRCKRLLAREGRMSSTRL